MCVCMSYSHNYTIIAAIKCDVYFGGDSDAQDKITLQNKWAQKFILHKYYDLKYIYNYDRTLQVINLLLDSYRM